jgi:NTE family protein
MRCVRYPSSGNPRKVRVWQALAIAAALLALNLAGCASRFVNERVAVREPYTPAVDHNALRGDPTMALVLAFSGGGTRAAAFSFGVLEELRRTRLPGHPPSRMLDEVDMITGVSGGSFTALSYALYGERLFDEYESRFLKRDVQGHLIASVMSPVNWPALASPAFGRSDLAAKYYDEILFHGATFGDVLAKRDTPTILVSATDISTGGRFTFGFHDFNLICSDVRKFPLSRAAAASSAVPVLLSAVTLDNHGGSCGPLISERIREFSGVEVANLPGRARLKVQEAAGLENRDRRPFLHLVDGGVSDNLAVRSVVESMDVIEHNKRFREGVGIHNMRRLAIIIVNSRADPPTDWDLHESGPGIVGQLVKSAGVPIERYSYEQIELLQNMVERWTLLRERARLALLEGRPGDASDADLPQIEFYPIDISFERIAEPERRRRFLSLPKSFVLADDDVDALRQVAGELLRENAVYQKLVRDLSESPPLTTP